MLSEAKDFPLEASSTPDTLRNQLSGVRSLTPFGMTLVACTSGSNLLQRAKPRNEFRRFHLYQIRFHVFDDPVAYRGRQKLNNCRVNFSRRGKGPAFLSIARDDFRNLIGKLSLNAAIRFCCQLCPLGNRSRSMVGASTVADRKAARLIAHFIHQSSMRVGDVECLHQLQARSARWRLVHPICF